MDPPHQEAPCLHSGPLPSSPDSVECAECGQEGAAQLDIHISCRARGYGQWPGCPGCWQSSCPWCPGTPCPGRPAWSWWGSGQNYWRVRFQVRSGLDLPFYKLGASRHPQLWPFSGCRPPVGHCLNHTSVFCRWQFIMIIKYDILPLSLTGLESHLYYHKKFQHLPMTGKDMYAGCQILILLLEISESLL